MSKDVLLSICIPSYNRGKILLELVKELIEIIEKVNENIEIIVSNNGSKKYEEDYKKISQMGCYYLTYYRFESNQGFAHNYNQVIRLSKGNYCLLLSDEDHVDVAGLRYYIQWLLDNPNIGMVRCATTKMYSSQTEDCYYKAGMEAINGYFLQGNYLSGIIYNRNFLTNALVDKFEKKYIKNDAYIAYPHMFVEAYLCTIVDVYRGKNILICEGIDQMDQEKSSDTGIIPYATLESRISQAKGYIDFIESLDCSNGIKLKMLSQVISKSFFLLSLVIYKYEESGRRKDEVFDVLSDEMKRIVKNSTFSFINQTEALLSEYIDACRDWEIRDYN